MSGAIPRAEFRFVCPLPNGMHARPASLLAEVARGFRSMISISVEGAPSADMASVLSVVALDIRYGQECVVKAEGVDADEATKTLRQYVLDTLPGVDTPVLTRETPANAIVAALPPALRAAGPAHSSGRAVGGGIGFGQAVHVAGFSLSEKARLATSGPQDDELITLRAALHATSKALAKQASTTSGMAADLLRAHAAIASDPALHIEMEMRVRGNATSAQAVVGAGEAFSARLRQADSAYIRDRAIDVIDVCTQILAHLPGGHEHANSCAPLLTPSVVFADSLTAHQLLGLNRAHLRGLVLGAVGSTSHVVILARSFEIPTIIDVRQPLLVARSGEEVIVDGEAGMVLPSPSPPTTRYYERERVAIEHAHESARHAAQGPTRTLDGHTIEVGANASSPEEVQAARREGADGIGLVRTEFVFLDRNIPPSEQEQLEVYSAIVREAGGKPVIFRTFDIGGDKSVPYLALPHEDNPFLGVRGLRLYPAHAMLLRSQLRAILRTSALGPVKIMAPMVTMPGEASSFRIQVHDARDSLEAEGVPVGDVPIGMMIEVPAAAMVIDQFCPFMDFFSIGTNDLCQYWTASDRGNTGVASLNDPLLPSFLRLLRTIVRDARVGGRWIGLCGEMGGRPENLPLMLGLGLSEISVSPGSVAEIKSMVRGASVERCRTLLDLACNATSVADVLEVLTSQPWRGETHRPIIEAESITLGSIASSKEEALHEAICLLRAQGRISSTRPVEEAAWAREATYSTGLGHGFAIPHCKSEAVTHPSLAVVRLATPIEWGSIDEQPVSIVMLLVVPSSDAAGSHMKIFARLARRLMHESFRDRLRAAESAEGLVGVLREELELS